MAQQKNALNTQFEINQAVYVSQPQHKEGRLEGIVEFFGQVDFASGKWVGVRLTGNSIGAGNTNGEVSGKQYFSCDTNCAVFVRPDQVTKRKLSRIDELRLRRAAIMTMTPVRQKYQSKSCSDVTNVTDVTVSRSLSKIEEIRARRETFRQHRLKFESPNSSVKSDNASRGFGSESSRRGAGSLSNASFHASNNENSLPPRCSPRLLYQSNQNNDGNDVKVAEQQKKLQEEQQKNETRLKRIIELENTMEMICQKLDNRSKELHNKEEETTMLRQSLSDAQHSVVGNEVELAKQQKKLLDEQQKNETMRNRLSELEDDVEIIYKKFDETAKKLQYKEEETMLLRQSLSNCQQGALGNETEMAEQGKILEEEQKKNVTMRNRITELEDNIVMINKTQEDTSKKIQKKEEETDMLRKSLSDPRNCVFGNDMIVVEQQNNIPNEVEENDTMRNKINELEGNIAVITKKLDETSEKLQNKEEETSKLRQLLSDAQHSIFGFKLRAAKLEQEVNKAKAEAGAGAGFGTYEIPFKKELQERIFMHMEHELETSREELEAERILKSAEAQELHDVKESLYNMEQEVKTTLACSLPSSPSAFGNESDVKIQLQALQAQVTMLQINFTELNDENDHKTKELETLQKALDLAKQDGLENGRKVQQSEVSAMEAFLKIKDDEIESQRQELDSLKESLQKEKERADRFAVHAEELKLQDNKIDQSNEYVSTVETDDEEVSRLKVCLSRVEQDACYFKSKYEELLLTNETEALLASATEEETKEVESVLQELGQEEAACILQELEEEEVEEVQPLLKELRQKEGNIPLYETEEDTMKQNATAADKELRRVLDEMDMFFDEPEKQQKSDTQVLGQPQSALPESQESLRKEGRDDNCVEEEKLFADVNPSSITQATNKESTNTDDEAIDPERELSNTEPSIHKFEETARSLEEGGGTKRGRNKITFWKRLNGKGNKGKSNVNITKSSKTNKVKINSLLCGPREVEKMGEF